MFRTNAWETAPKSAFNFYTLSLTMLLQGIFVEEGGSVDLHGLPKLGWTQLTQDLVPGGPQHTLHLAQHPHGWY